MYNIFFNRTTVFECMVVAVKSRSIERLKKKSLCTNIRKNLLENFHNILAVKPIDNKAKSAAMSGRYVSYSLYVDALLKTYEN